MKGVKVIRASVSNAIDIYPFLKKAAPHFSPQPTTSQLQAYYMGGLLKELAAPSHFWFLARRARGYLGVAHAFVVPSRWDGALETLFVDMLYVIEKRRNRGVGTKLINELKLLAETLKLRRIDFLVDDKDFGGEKVKTLMRISL